MNFSKDLQNRIIGYLKELGELDPMSTWKLNSHKQKCVPKRVEKSYFVNKKEIKFFECGFLLETLDLMAQTQAFYV